MAEQWHVKKTGPGLAIEEMIARLLGSEFVVEEFDPARPLAQQVHHAHVLLVRSMPVTREVIDGAPRLRLIQRPGVHLEGVDIEYARGAKLFHRVGCIARESQNMPQAHSVRAQ